MQYLEPSLDQSAIIVTCLACNQPESVTVNTVDFLDWKNGELAQICFPYLNSSERELLISKICGKCFDKMFPED